MQSAKLKPKLSAEGLKPVAAGLSMKPSGKKNEFLYQFRCGDCRTLSEVSTVTLFPMMPRFEAECELCHCRTGFYIKDSVVLGLKVLS
jgi:hypothetical protein